MKSIHMKRPNDLYMISSLEVTRSMSEFGFSAIFMLFMVHLIKFSFPLAANINGIYYGIAYMFPILCSIISGKYLNTKRLIILGCLSVILSQLLFFFSASLYSPTATTTNVIFFNKQTMLMFLGLFFLAFGTGFTVINLPKMVKNLFSNDDDMDKGLSMLYFSTNLGGTVGPILLSVIAGDNPLMFKWGFLVLAILLTVGLVLFSYNKDHRGKFIESLRNAKIKSIKEEALSIKNSIRIRNLIARLNRLENPLTPVTPVEKDRLAALFIIFIAIIAYRVAYHQTSVSTVMFIDTCVNKNFFSYIINTEAFLSINPIYILIFTPLIVKFNSKLAEKGKSLDFITKIIIGMILMVLAFFVLFAVTAQYTGGETINLGWILFYEFFLAWSELFAILTCYTMISKLVRDDLFTHIFAFFTATNAFGKFFAGFLSSNFPVLHITSASILGLIKISSISDYFLFLVVLNLIVAVALIILRKPLLNRLHGITS